MVPQRDKSEQEAKAALLKALNEGDVGQIVQISLDSFMRLIFDRPISFQRFLKHTGQYLDNVILDIAQQEQLNFVGGKLILELPSNTIIQLTADLYFQNVQKMWILKKRSGQIDSSQFRDWDIAPETNRLRAEKQLVFPIDPPLEK